MARQTKKLSLGKGAAFAKSRLKRFRQERETWEADFTKLPQALSQNETRYLGPVVVKKGGSLLAQEEVEHTPDVNDLAALLAHAMSRPLSGRGHRPKRIRVRVNLVHVSPPLEPRRLGGQHGRPSVGGTCRPAVK